MIRSVSRSLTRTRRERCRGVENYSSGACAGHLHIGLHKALHKPWEGSHMAQNAPLRGVRYEDQTYVNLCRHLIEAPVRAGGGLRPFRPSGYVVAARPTRRVLPDGRVQIQLDVSQVKQLEEIQHVLNQRTTYIVSELTGMYIAYFGAFPGHTFVSPVLKMSPTRYRELRQFVCK